MPILHEHVILRRYEQTSKFADIASRTPSIDDTLGSLGWFTKRLDLVFKDNSVTSRGPVQALLRELPNLLTFTVKAGGFPVTADVLGCLAPTLEYLELGESTGPIDQATLQLVLNSKPNLRSVIIPKLERVQAEGPIPRPLACQLLFMTLVSTTSTSFDLPSLTALGIQPRGQAQDAVRVMADSWGCRIRSLFLDLTWLAQNTCEDITRDAWEKSPFVTELFICATFCYWVLPSIPNSKVRFLGVKFEDQLRTPNCNDLFEFLANAQKKLVDLKVIQFFDEQNVIHLQKNHSTRCRRWVEDIKARGNVSIQDHLEQELVF
jgi:hypothetical protein